MEQVINLHPAVDLGCEEKSLIHL